MREILNQLVATRTGTFAVLLLAAFLEAYADSCFQSGLHRTTGAMRYFAFAIGTLLLALYGLLVNTPPWDFGKLLGVYVVLFFVVVQVLAMLRFQQTPTAPTLVGGSLIVAGGAVMTFWKG
jgi:drug/metabolite transporter superfamily protein YnfA